ncbi:MAG: ABC transporter permease [Phenylobacterium sp.]|uniref:ABC transporter permease n=1 Tax=Phenylobacterium sp. TaxID=1871053 RepID=UPI00391D5E5C
MNDLRLLGRYFDASIRSQLQYPGSAIMLGIGAFVTTIVDMLAAWALFDRFGQVQGWRLGDIAVFYGVVSTSFAITDFVTRGFDVFGTEFVKTGAFDRILLRPRSPALQLVGYEFRISRFGRLAQALLVLFVGAAVIGVQWTPEKALLLAWTITGGVALFSGLLILQASFAFWTTESLEVFNVLTYGGIQAAQFPLSLYAAWFRNFLIFVVPLGCVAYYPVLAILDQPDPLGAPGWWLPAAPAAGFAFLGLSFLAWRAGIRRYTSTGS